MRTHSPELPRSRAELAHTDSSGLARRSWPFAPPAVPRCGLIRGRPGPYTPRPCRLFAAPRTTLPLRLHCAPPRSPSLPPPQPARRFQRWRPHRCSIAGQQSLPSVRGEDPRRHGGYTALSARSPRASTPHSFVGVAVGAAPRRTMSGLEARRGRLGGRRPWGGRIVFFQSGVVRVDLLAPSGVEGVSRYLSVAAVKAWTRGRRPQRYYCNELSVFKPEKGNGRWTAS